MGVLECLDLCGLRVLSLNIMIEHFTLSRSAMSRGNVRLLYSVLKLRGGRLIEGA